MKFKVNWKKGAFSNLYRIYTNGQLIGKLKNKAFSKTSDGELNGVKYSFKTVGVFKQHTEIINSTEDKVIGKITYNNWITKAKILVDNKTFSWKYDNVWNTKWSICNSEGIKILYSGSTLSGQIESNTEDSLLLLGGLFVTNSLKTTSLAVIVAVFVPVWINLLN